jgi:hypothetical protein
MVAMFSLQQGKPARRIPFDVAMFFPLFPMEWSDFCRFFGRKFSFCSIFQAASIPILNGSIAAQPGTCPQCAPILKGNIAVQPVTCTQ